MSPLKPQLYHITPFWNVASVHLRGVCPSFAAGTRKRSYFVSQVDLTWALEHIAKRHGCPLGDLFICRMAQGEHYRLMFGKWFISERRNPVDEFMAVPEAARRGLLFRAVE